MALQGRFSRICNFVRNYNKNYLGNVFRNNYPLCHQTAGLRQSLEDKLNLPVKPKRPLTPYFKFMVHIRPEIKRKNPDAKVTDIVKETAAQWEKVDLQYKHNLEAEYKKEQEIYAKERLEYETKLTDDQRKLLKQARLDLMESKEKRKLKKKCKDNNKPKKACSAFVLFMKTKISLRGEMKFKEFQKKIAAEWQLLPEPQKKPFIDEMHRQMKEYQREMVEWERKMIKMGNTDIVRHDALIDPKPKHPKDKKSE